MLLRLSTLATGRTGIRPSTAQAYASLLNAGITPVVYEYGSLGCSGDLAPLASCALALLGEGSVRDASGRVQPAKKALRGAGLAPVELGAKEGLALINGTDGMLGMLVLAAHDLQLLFRCADIAAAMSVEALLGSVNAFAEDLVALRPHPGQQLAARNLRALMAVADRRQSPGTGLHACRCLPRCAARRRSTVLPVTLSLMRRTSRIASWQRPSTIPSSLLTGGWRVWQLPRCPCRLRPRLPGDRGRRRRIHLGTTERPGARCRA